MKQVALDGAGSGSPLYKVVKRRLGEALHRNDWKPGEVIPSEKQLAERFHVSIGTVRKAVDELVAESVLVRQQGRGTFVAAHSEARYVFSFFHVRRHDGYKEHPEVAMVRFGRAVADDYAAQMLGVAPGAGLFRIQNVLRLEGTPVVVDDIYLPAERFRGLTEARARARKGTLYQLYQAEFDVTVLRTDERLRSIVADKPTAALLEVAPGAPLLQVIRLAFSFRDRPVELRYSYVNTSRHEYFTAPVDEG